MDLENLIEGFENYGWHKDIENKKEELNSFPKSVKKKLEKQIISKIERNTQLRKNTVVIKDLLLLGFALNKNSFDKAVKRIGVLRHSNYLEVSKSPVSLYCKYLINSKELLNLSNIEVLHFTSLINFERGFFELKKLYDSITKELLKIKNKRKKKNQLPESFIKSLLAYSEFVFAKGHTGHPEERIIQGLEYFNKEQILEATSFLVSRWDKLIGIKKKDLYLIDFSLIKSNRIKNILFLASKYKYLCELEIKIESFGFCCDISTNNKILIYSKNNNLGKCECIHNIIANAQRNADFRKFSHDYPNLFTDEKFYSTLKEKFPDSLELKKYPIPRYILKVAEPIINFAFNREEFLLTKEELFQVYHISKELFLLENQIENFKIKEELTIKEFIRLKRIFGLFCYLLTKDIIENKDEDNDELLLNALCQTLSKEQLYNFLSYSNATEADIETFLDIIVWESGFDDFLDLQYTPLLYVDENFLILPAITYMSNLVRNLFKSESKKGNNINKRKTDLYNSLVVQLTGILQNFGFTCLTEIEIKFKNNGKTKSDIDILAIYQKNVFIFECKDSIYSTSSFEDRTVYRAIFKASEQLAYSCTAIKDKEFINSFNKKHNLEIDETFKVFGIILTTNRRFWGLHLNKYPVRNFNEITSLLNKGIWTFGIDENISEKKIWKGEKFQVDDLIRFIEEDKCPHNKIYDSMIETRIEFNNNISIQDFGLVWETYLNKINSF